MKEREWLLDELLVSAGLVQTRSEPVMVSMDFVVGTEPESESLVLRCDRINTAPIELRLPLHHQ